MTHLYCYRNYKVYFCLGVTISVITKYVLIITYYGEMNNFLSDCNLFIYKLM